MTCLACGYVGLMGVSRTDVKWIDTPLVWIVYIAALVFVVVFISVSQWVVAAFVLALCIYCLKFSTFFECPNCQAEIKK